jgi:hypothetical protein
MDPKDDSPIALNDYCNRLKGELIKIFGADKVSVQDSGPILGDDGKRIGPNFHIQLKHGLNLYLFGEVFDSSKETNVWFGTMRDSIQFKGHLDEEEGFSVYIGGWQQIEAYKQFCFEGKLVEHGEWLLDKMKAIKEEFGDSQRAIPISAPDLITKKEKQEGKSRD